MGPTLLCELGLFLLCTLLCTGHAQDAVLTIEPNWSSFFIGEFVTFMCDMNEGADTDWEYKLNKDGQEFVLYNTHKDYRLPIIYSDYSGEYQCSGRRKSSNYTKSSNTVSVTASDKPRATLTAGTTIIPVGGSVTLTCSVGTSAEWKYEWFRHTQNTTEVQIRRDDQPNRVIRVSQGGIYRCRGGRGRDPDYYTDISADLIIEITFSNKVAVKQQHNWTQIFSGETITLTCEVQEGGEPTEWEYQWRGPRQTTQWTHNNYWTFRVSESSSGDYMCKSRRRDDSYSSTEWSEAFTLSVTNKPRATLTAGTTIIPVGGSVTLTCSVGSSAEWKYEWFRRTQRTTEVPIRRDDQQNSVIRVSQGGIYRCRGRRGNSVYYTYISADLIIEITFSNKVAVKQQQHNWPQIFSGETITLTCEVQEGGEPTEWYYGWRGPRQTTQWTHNNSLTFRVSESSSGDYMCKSRRRDDSYSSTEWSEAFTLSVTSKSSAVWLIVGLVCGVSLLIILLLLLYRCRQSKYSCFTRSIQSESHSSSSTTNHGVNQDETHEYDSLHPGADEPQSVTYSLIELKNFGKKKDRLMYAEVNKKQKNNKKTGQ
ncbi:Fc receptor-like protein 5 [Archocentrus centrarchus]|uniref:Fc receptor-like protein 5 n=1 Tax=Archocentrus centrarchus TaxID=63155 RepID=UPI0011E9F8FD|nr:Fc receptor-like protein 5 [Archocentrus centrarchus]